MKLKPIFIIITILLTNVCNSQQTSGEAYYIKKINVNTKSNGSEDAKSQMLRYVTEKMKKSLEKTYVLQFDKEQSTYKEEITLGSVTGQVSNSDNVSILFKDIKKRKYIETKDLLGKIFRIEDSLQSYSWTLKNETKTIGKYICYKAISTYKKSSKELQNIEVWYTLDIPVNNGPENLWGLPGLILEVTYDKVQLLCTKIILNNDTTVKVPRRGKKVTAQEYEKIESKKMQEFKQNYNLKN